MSWMRERLRRLTGKYKKYETVFGSEEGKYVLADIIREAGLYLPSYETGSFDHTAYNEGSRRLAMYINNMAGMTPEEAKRIAGTDSDEGDED